eukprot:scaffold30215_cov148-Skeletonema_menzelii.AAC.3
MPAGKTDAEAASEFASEGRKSAVQSMKERMSAGTTDAEAASEIAKNCGMANAKRLDELAYRDADTKLHLDFRTTEGLPQVNHESAGTVRCSKCKKRHGFWVEPHRFGTVSNCCPNPTCFSGLYKDQHGVTHDLCQKHYKQKKGWKYKGK